MTHARSAVVFRHLRTLYGAGTAGGLDDRQLLERFTTGPGEAAELAFATLVQRHGPMVLRVCRGVLGDPHEAQDAFQATFLILARKADSLWIGESLGPWLHEVALRVATKARAGMARRRRAERCVAERAATVALEAALRDTEVDYGAEQRINDLQKLAQAQLQAGRSSDALETLKKAEQLARAELQGWDRSLSLFEIARDRAAAGDPRGALRMVDGVTFEGKFARTEEVTACGLLVEGLVKGGDRPAAEALIRRAIAARDAFGPDATADRNLASRWIAGMQAEAGMLDEAIRTANEIRGDALALDLVELGRNNARARLERGDGEFAARILDEVIRVSGTIRGEGDRAETLLLLARQRSERGDLDEAERAAREIPDRYPQKAFALAEVANARREAGGRDSVAETLRAATRAAETVPTEAERSDALRSVAEAWAKSGGIPEATRLALTIADPAARVEALRQAATARSAAGRSEDARCLLNQATESAGGVLVGTKRAVLLRGLAVSWAQAGDCEAAGQAFRRAITAVEALPNPAGRCEALGEIGGAQLVAGDREAARSTLRRAVEAALVITDEKSKIFLQRPYSLSAVATIQAENGDADGALAWASDLQSPTDKSWALRGVALGLLKRTGAWTPQDSGTR